GRPGPDQRREAGGDAGADPGRAQRPLALSRADVGPDHRDERPTEAEDEGHEEVLETRARAVARDRGGSEPSDEARRDGDREVGLDGDQRGDRAGPEDGAEERPAGLHPAEGAAQDGPSGP